MPIGRFLSDNGLFATVSSATRRILAAPRNLMVGKKLRCSGLSVGRRPTLLGLRAVRLGDNFRAGDGLWLEAIYSSSQTPLGPLIQIGKNAALGDQVRISASSRVEIGDNLLTGNRVYISDNQHGIYAGDTQSVPEIAPRARQIFSPAAVVVGANVWLGEGVCVLAGARIGNGCVIGANAVVTGDIPEGSIAVGVPARVVKRFSSSTGRWEPVAGRGAKELSAD